MSYQRSFEKVLQVGIVGVGSHCYRNILPAMNYLPVHIRAVCDINANLAAATARQYGCESWYTGTAEMYEKEQLDAVFLCVSPQLHPRLTCEALDAGVHVWLEKPVSMRSAEVDDMIGHRRDRVVVVGYKKAFMPATQKALEIIHSDTYGHLRSILAVYRMNLPVNGQEVLENRIATDMLLNGCHPLSLMLATGGAVKAVTAIRSEKDSGIIILEYANGVIGNFHLASGTHAGMPVESYSFFGDGWHLNIDNCCEVKLERGIPFDYGRTTSYLPEGDDSGAVVWRPQNGLATLENKALFTQGIYNELMYFCTCVLDNKPAVQGSLEFAREVMRVYEACLLSNGKRIEI